MKIRYPIRKADGREYKHYDELMTDMKKMDHGWWLVGVNRYWHGGVHVGDTSSPASVLGQETPEKSVPLQCMADGEIVAWRVCRDYTQALLYENHAEKMELRHSPTFLLVKSVHKPDEEDVASWLDLYHLYMQMAPLSEYPKRKLYRVTEKGHGVRLRQHSRGDNVRELAPDVIKNKHGLSQTLSRGDVLAMLHETSFTLKGKTEPFGLVQKITHGKPEGPLFWVSMRPEFMEPDGECYVCLPVWMHHALNHGVFDDVVLPPAPLKIAIKAGDPVGFLGAQDISKNGYTREFRTEYKAHIELLSPDAHVPDVLANIKDIKSGAQYVKLKLKRPFYLRNGDGDDATFSPMSAITRKDGDMLLRRETTHPFRDKDGVVWFQIRPHTWMHQDDVEQLSQHDLTQLNFTTIVAEPTTDFSRPLDENWVTEAVKSLASHFDAEKGPDSAQAKTFFDGLLGQLRVRNAGGMTEWDSNELNKRLFNILHSSQMNLPQLTRRLVVQHDSDWHGGSENSRWSRLFGDGWDPMNGVNKLFLRDHEWMSKVPPFMEGKPVWHFHPLEFLEMIKDDSGRISLEMLRKIWTNSSHVSGGILQQVANELNENLERCHLDTDVRLYHFMAQIFQETGANFSISENLNYSDTALPSLFSYYRRHANEAIIDGRTSTHPAILENIANKAYGGRNGNNMPGDGWRYRGQGLKQLTGRDNYRGFTAYSKKMWSDSDDYELNPGLVSSDMKVAVRSALYFWDDNKLYMKADEGYSKDASYAITAVVNKHTDSYEARFSHLTQFVSGQILDGVF
ncbi:glycoside hydrolase family 19 protein [Yersinia mollaretii]|uniref:glycoside hydrolase family 19 protein n=1 Tax=Yersinia mollaretii TaxID=33060 RepID=UPI00069E1FCC|nr:hypothetical protein [Yersinia mollaretii]